jgi:hypothetical protein
VLPLFEWALHALAAVVAFLIIMAAAFLLHQSAHLVRGRLPRFFIWLIHGVAWLLFLLDVLGFVLLILPPFWDLIPQELQALIRHWIGLPVQPVI